MKVFVDIETGDPDDILTLIYLLGLDQIDIIAITIMPGSQKQINLVKYVLSKFSNKQDIPIGSYRYEQGSLSPWYTKAFGKIPDYTDKQITIDAGELMFKLCDDNVVLFTGGPNKNLGKAMEKGEFKLGLWMAQGGFAGYNVVPEEHVLPKFKNKLTFPTYNFGGSIKESSNALKHDGIKKRMLCSKNVCHNVIYDNELKTRLIDYIDTNKDKNKNKYISIKLIYDALDRGYRGRNNRGEGKKLHDLLPAICITYPDVCEWRQVELYNDKYGWGSNIKEGTNTFISVSHDKQKFIEYLLLG